MTPDRRSANPAPVDDAVLWRDFARSVRDNAVAEFVVQALRVGGIIVLARALSPDEFGVFRVLMVIGVLAAVTNEAGLPDALIQRSTLSSAHESTAWWITAALSAATAIVLFAAAPAIAAMMEMPGLEPGLRLLCVPIFLEGTAVTAGGRLRRELKFTALAVADVLAELAFLIVAIYLLWRDLLLWSLPAGLAARFVVHASVVWLADPRPQPGWPRKWAARDLTRFAATVFGGRFIYMLSSNADFLLVGRLLGSSALGLYALSWDLLRFVPDRLYRVAGRVTLPAFCKLQHDNAALARAFKDFFGYVARIVLPICACVVIAAPELLNAIYGPHWIEAAVPLRLLAIGLAFAGLRVGIGSVYYAKDHPSMDLYLHGTRMVLIVMVVVALAGTGLPGVSLGVSAVEVAISVAGEWLACRLIGLNLRDLVSAAAPGLRVALVCAVAAYVGKVLGHAWSSDPLPRLAAAGIPPLVTYCFLEARTVKQMINRGFTPPAPGIVAVAREQP